MKKAKYFFKDNKFSILLSFVLIFSIFTRFYLLSTHLHFAGDEATISDSVRSIFYDHKFLSLGQSASVGNNIYHGAFFYYIYLIPGILTNFSALGFASFTAIASIVSIYLLYISLRDIYSKRIAIVSTIVYALSYNVILYSRWEWNPNIIPFFTVLSLFALVKFLKGDKRYLILFFFSVSTITQMHLVEYLFIPILLILIFFLYKKCKDIKIWSLSILAFIFPWIPFIYHEIKYKFLMTRSLFYILLHPTSHTTIWEHITHGSSYTIFLYIQTIELNDFAVELFLLTAIAFLYVFIKDRKKNYDKAILSLYILLIIVFTFIIFAFYPGLIFIHFGEHLFPIFSITTALFLEIFFERKYLIPIPIILILIIAEQNYIAFDKGIINGVREYETEKSICKIVQQSSDKNISIEVNNMYNPNSVWYICKNEYGLNQGRKPTTNYIFETDFKDKLKYTVSKV